MNRYKIFEGFTQSVLFADSVPIPRFLLEHYHSLEITNEELALVLHLLSGSDEMSLEDLAPKMGLREDDVEQMMAHLQKKGILNIREANGKAQSYCLPKYDLSGLMDQLLEKWGILRYQEINNALNVDQFQEKGQGEITFDQAMAQLKLTFEQELARPLSHMDCDHIRQWVLAGWSPELITQALRRGVSAGVRTFRYLDSILREWEKKGIRTVDEAIEDDLYFQSKRTKKRVGERVAPDKLAAMRAQYEDLYL